MIRFAADSLRELFPYSTCAAPVLTLALSWRRLSKNQFGRKVVDKLRPKIEIAPASRRYAELGRWGRMGEGIRHLLSSTTPRVRVHTGRFQTYALFRLFVRQESSHFRTTLRTDAPGHPPTVCCLFDSAVLDCLLLAALHTVTFEFHCETSIDMVRDKLHQACPLRRAYVRVAGLNLQ